MRGVQGRRRVPTEAYLDGTSQGADEATDAAIRRRSAAHQTSGGYSEGDTPDPIPNSAVKPLSPHGTAGYDPRESRTLPD